MSAVTRDLLEPIVAPVVEAMGLDLEDLKVSRAGRRNVVRIIVDADGGVDLDRCADASRAISVQLDTTDVLGSTPYTLEVSSPGVTRPLTLPRHWRRGIGRLVRVVLADGGEVTGRITAADETSAQLDVDGTARSVTFAEVGKARVQVEFSRTEAGEE